MRLCVASMLCLLVGSTNALAQSWPSVAGELPRTGGGEDDVAVIVGVSDYFALPDVPGAADNARDWFQYLLRVRGVPSARATLLVDSDATRGRIERALKAAASSARPNGRAIVVFIGHGAPAPSGDDGLLLGVDTQSDADSLAERGVPQELVASIMATGKQRETVLIYDACFSGMTNDGKAPLVPGNQATLPNRRVAPKQSTVVLAASESFAGPLPGQQRPAFSYVMLGALRGWGDVDRSKDVTLAEAFSFTDDTIRAALKQSQRAPQMRGSASAAPFAKAAEEPPDVSAILLGRCPDNTKWSGRGCVSAGCPAGTTWNGAACMASAAAVQCPAGTTWNGTACVASSVTCPSGTTWRDGACRGNAVADVAPGQREEASGGGGASVGADGKIHIAPRHASLLAGFTGGVRFVEPLAFDAAKATLKKSSTNAAMLDALADVLTSLRRNAEVQCHSDAVGNDEYNRTLTQGRAESVRAELVKRGVQNVDAKGYGEDMPIADNRTTDGRAQNRRCEIRVH